jgi:hypothetical protein
MCEKPLFPKIEARIAERGLNYSAVGTAHGMGGQAFGRRMRGEIEFDLSEIVWLIDYFECDFSDLF